MANCRKCTCPNQNLDKLKNVESVILTELIHQIYKNTLFLYENALCFCIIAHTFSWFKVVIFIVPKNFHLWTFKRLFITLCMLLTNLQCIWDLNLNCTTQRNLNAIKFKCSNHAHFLFVFYYKCYNSNSLTFLTLLFELWLYKE